MMSRNVFFLMSVWILCLMPVANAANIIWVDEGAGGFAEWQAALEPAGHTVTNMTGMGTLDDAKIAAMNAADLVVVSRDTNSGDYNNDATERANWNGLTVPLIQTSTYLIRDSRWQWIAGAGTPVVDAPDILLIVENHLIFRGVGAAGDEIPMLTASTNLTDVSDGGNGQVLATHTDGRLWIVYWEADVAFHGGTTEIPSAPRMWFGAAGNEDSGTKGGMNLSDDGLAIFLNAVRFITGGISPELATAPSPELETDDVPRDVVLAWTPGDYAVKHDVYLGTVLDDVNGATVTDPMGVLVSQGQDATSFDAGALAFGQTYYWRVDEVNGAPDNTVFKGELWNFTTEPFAYPVADITATASGSHETEMGPEKTIDGSGLDAMDQHSTQPTDMWLSAAGAEHWIQYEFTQALKLDEMWVWNSNQIIEAFVGLGAKDVVIETSLDGAAWTALEDATQFAQAPGTASYTANTIVDFAGTLAKFVRITINAGYGMMPQYGLSEVRFFSIPVQAREPQPASGATTDSVDVMLAWRAGREAVSHEISLGTDSADLAVIGTSSEASFDPGELSYGTTYFWKIDEVNEAATPARNAGELWSFTTPDFGIVDSFDQYDDKCNRIFFSWEDGLGHSGGENIDGCDVPASNGNGGGSIVGNDEAPFAEQTIVTAGSSQSLPLNYDNSFGPSEATLAIDGQDWSASGVQTLALAFYGEPDNTGTLYVKINNTKVLYDLDPSDIARAGWQAWNIDLTGLNGLQNVTGLTIGVDGASAAGMLYIDDIRLYPQAGELITPVEPGSAGLMAYYEFENNANDSSVNGLDGSLIAGQYASSGSLNTGSALQLNLAGHVDLGNPAALDFGTGDWTVTAWFKTDQSGTGDANKGTIYAKGGDSGGGHRYALIMSETTEGVLTLVTDDDATKYVVNSSSVTNDDQWHSVVGQREGTAIRIFIDGQLEGTATAAEDYDLSGTTQHNAYVGAVTNNGDSSLYKYYGGLIDELKVFGRALSAEEILWLAGKTSPVHKPL
jgi:hypothetical protein